MMVNDTAGAEDITGGCVMATAVQNDIRDVSIGRILGRAFGTVGSNPVVTLSISLVFGALPSALIAWLFPNAALASEGDLFRTTGFAALAFLLWVASLAIAAITQGVLTRATIAHAQGRKASMAESIGAGVAVLVPLIFLALLIAIACMIGVILLIIPGVMLYCAWAVAVPALVEERAGISAALSRSADLTRGYRWRIFGALLLLMVIFWLISGVAAAVGLGITGLSGLENGNLPTGYMIWNILIGTLSSVLWSTLQASMYVELRNAKEGPDQARLQEVFA